MPKSRPPRKPKAVREQEARRKKKPSGKPAGSRHNIDKTDKGSPKSTVQRDPRVGSKKPVKLIAQEPQHVKPKKRYATPKHELEAIEADGKLTALLDQLDNGETLSYADQEYVETLLDRHEVLCDLLGIKDDAEEASASDDPLDELKPINPKDFQ